MMVMDKAETLVVTFTQMPNDLSKFESSQNNHHHRSHFQTSWFLITHEAKDSEHKGSKSYWAIQYLNTHQSRLCFQPSCSRSIKTLASAQLCGKLPRGVVFSRIRETTIFTINIPSSISHQQSDTRCQASLTHKNSAH